MFEAEDHVSYVRDWLEKEANGCGTAELVELSELAMTTLWKRTYLTLGEVTLTAIVDRVLYSAAEQYRPFGLLKVEPVGIDFREMRAQAGNFSENDLKAGIDFILSEFLIVIGNLTAEILTPALHSELSKVSLKNRTPEDESGKGQS